jgi:hypothetical protein
MVFLVGARRSGTNWLQRILVAHPDVVGLPGETHLFSHGIRMLTERVQHGALTSGSTGRVYMDRDRFLDASRAFCDAVFGGLAETLHPGAPVIVERTPMHVYELDLIGDVYPDAAVLHIIRDGRDVVRSLLAQSWGPTEAVEAADEWARSITSARAAAPQLERYREVRYEELLVDPRPHITALFDWLGLRHDGDIVESSLVESGVTFNVDRTQPELAQGKWRRGLTDAQLADVVAAAGQQLAELGYADALPADEPRAPARTETAPEPLRQRRRPLRRRSEARAPRAAAPTAADDTMELAQQLVDRFLGALAAGRSDTAVSMLRPDARVRIFGAQGVVDARGEAGRAALATTVADLARDWRRQTLGEVHPDVNLFTVALSHDGADGGQRDDVVVLRRRGEQLSEVTIYRFPLRR